MVNSSGEKPSMTIAFATKCLVASKIASSSITLMMQNVKLFAALFGENRYVAGNLLIIILRKKSKLYKVISGPVLLKLNVTLLKGNLSAKIRKIEFAKDPCQL